MPAHRTTALADAHATPGERLWIAQQDILAALVHWQEEAASALAEDDYAQSRKLLATMERIGGELEQVMDLALGAIK